MDISELAKKVSINKADYNKGLTYCPASLMIGTLGTPRKTVPQSYSSIDKLHNPLLSGLIKTVTTPIGSLSGLSYAIDDLTLRILPAIASEQPFLYQNLKQAGVLVVRAIKLSGGSWGTQYSNHSWGTAIDLHITGSNCSRPVQHFHTLLAPIFNRYEWFWGAGFSSVDAMHFEVSSQKINKWKAAGYFGVPSRTSVANTVRSTNASARASLLKRGDAGSEVGILQTKLRQRGYRGLRVDNHFGPVTENTVKDLQRKAGLVADGLVGNNTRRYLGM